MKKEIFKAIVFFAGLLISENSYASDFDGNGPSAGYRGFVEAGYTLGVGEYGEDRATLLTTHGYQINPYLFVGAGSGINAFLKKHTTFWSVPIYADLRINLINHSICPFVDLKFGYSVADIEGIYLCPSVGCRMRLGNKTALYASLGYEFQKANFRTTENVIKYDSFLRNYYTTVKNNQENKTCSGISIKVGFEF